MKQGKHVSNNGATGTSSSKSGSANGSVQCVLKVLTPEALAAAIIGKGGSVIAAIRQSCQAKITISDHGAVYPQTDCRVLNVQAASEESLNEVTKKIIEKLGDVAEGGELKLKTLVPRAAVGGIIGKGGATIKQIRQTSGANVSISEVNGSGPGAEQVVSVAGSSEALEYVMTEVNKQIQMLKAEAWFSQWASAAFGAQAAAPTQGPPNAMHSELDSMMRVAQSLPPYVLEDSRGFALSCVVPNHLVGGLIGRSGAGTREVQQLTNTKISIREITGDPENRSLNITGPLTSACAAYMLMMKRYLDAEAQHAQGGRQRPR